jgi:hypothetical protein
LGRWWASVPEERLPTHPEAQAEIARQWAEPWGDRRQEIVFIGVGLDREAICAQLNAALIEGDDFEPEAWAGLADPFPRWVGNERNARPTRAALRDAAVGVGVADTPEGLSALHRPGCAAAIWRRQWEPGVQSWLDGLAPDLLPRRGSSCDPMRCATRLRRYAPSPAPPIAPNAPGSSTMWRCWPASSQR